MHKALLLVAALVALAPAPSRADDCAIVGRPRSQRIRVTPSGAPPFDVVSSEIDVAVHPTADPGLANVDVATGLTFTGTTTYVPYALRANTTAADGILRLTRRSVPAAVRDAPSGVIADVYLAYEVIAKDVALPCSALVVGEAQQPSVVPGLSDGTPRLIPRDPIFTVFARPGDAQGLTIEGTSHVWLRRVGVRDTWTEVSFSVGGGIASFRGFVPSERLQMGLPQGTGRAIGDPAPARGTTLPSSADARIYIGPATIDTGTSVTAARGTGAWATTVAGTTFIVRTLPDDAFTEILVAPGIADAEGCAHGLCRAYVPTASVHRVNARR